MEHKVCHCRKRLDSEEVVWCEDKSTRNVNDIQAEARNSSAAGSASGMNKERNGETKD